MQISGLVYLTILVPSSKQYTSKLDIYKDAVTIFTTLVIAVAGLSCHTLFLCLFLQLLKFISYRCFYAAHAGNSFLSGLT